MITAICAYISLMIPCSDLPGRLHDIYTDAQIMTPETLHDIIIPASEALLPERMRHRSARAMLIAIALQESDLKHRRQILTTGRWWEQNNTLAVSYYQMETIGIAEVIRHPTSREHALEILSALDYPADAWELRDALTYDAVLATAFARLMLWRLPQPLPAQDDAETAYQQYIAIWRPGAPRRDRWDERYAQAWQIVSSKP